MTDEDDVLKRIGDAMRAEYRMQQTEIDRLTADAVASRNDLHVALDEVRLLRAENDALREIARAVAAYDTNGMDNESEYKCRWCYGGWRLENGKYENHDDTCTVTKARALLGDGDK